MKNNWKYIVLFFAVLVTSLCCRERYTLPANAVVNTNYLVVEGNINVGQDSTVIQLSRVTPVTDTTKVIVPETGATVVVETDAGGSFPLQELNVGVYIISNITAGLPNTKYRLNITTAGDKKYLSDFVDFKKTPAIDGINWEQLEDGVHIYANTHDPSGKSKYYKWDFIETWEYHSSLKSLFVYQNGQILPRPATDTPFYTCYQTIPSSAIITQSTTRLASDLVYKKQLMFIPTSDYKIGVLYSILVKQTVLTEAGFDFWAGLSKNTEQLGSLFDALPSQLTGNIHSLANPPEPVVGFITATTTEQQRLWIKKTELVNWAYPPGPYQACDSVHIDNDPSQFGIFEGGSYLVIELVQPSNPFSQWIAAPVDCVDCRLKGGVLTKPSFWP